MFTYDTNGNLTRGNGRTITYTPYNKVERITKDPGPNGGDIAAVDFFYGADGNRIIQSVGSLPSGSTEVLESARTVYVGMGGTGKSLYERTRTTLGGSTKTEHVHFIYSGGAHGGSASALKIITQETKANSSTSTLTTATKYYHFDHLWSVTEVSHRG